MWDLSGAPGIHKPTGFLTFRSAQHKLKLAKKKELFEFLGAPGRPSGFKKAQVFLHFALRNTNTNLKKNKAF